MADYSSGRSIGARVRSARRARGFRTTRELAAAIDQPNLTESILENIEAGRKADLPVSQLLNVAIALQVPVSYLLAPMTRPLDGLDLPNLSSAFTDMTAAEFDAWLSSIPNADYRAETAAERSDRAELQAFRELQVHRRELRRLRIVAGLEEAHELGTQSRIEEITRQIDVNVAYLRSAGWEVDAATK
jgi:transcriptional regulator with XRE-family HTH domain